MEPHQFDHIARSASALINTTQLTFTGLSSLMKTVRVPSPLLASRIESAHVVEMLIYENHDPEGCVDLLNLTMGEHTAFHEKFGYCLRAQVSWDAVLPDGWTERLKYINYPLGRSAHLLSISPADMVLANLESHPDPMLNMDLLMGGSVTTDTLLELLGDWHLPAAQKHEIRLEILRLGQLVDRLSRGQPCDVGTIEQPAAADFDGHSNVVSIVGRGSRHRLHVA